MIHSNTTNKSFLRMYYILDQMGIKNNTFFLQLYDSTLADIDPFDEDNLTVEQKTRINIEILKNPWYYFREIVRFPVSNEKQRFELTRATLAILWSLLNDLHSYVVIPRQSGKSYTVAAFYSWLIYWGAKDFASTFFGNNDALVVQNLTRVKDLRETLPSYLNLKNNNDIDNQKMLVYNEGSFKNTIITKAPGMNEDSANNVGRGNSTMGQWYDEFAFIPYVWIQYGAAIPAYSTVSTIAEKTGTHHHIIITTTAGNKNSKIGSWAYEFLQQCANFTELLYDKAYYDSYGNCIGFNRAEINDYITHNNGGRRFLRIEYSWDELSKPMDYLEKQQAEMRGMDEFARGVLNIWTDSNADHPLGQERVQELMNHISSPCKVQMVDKIYVLKYYRDPELLKSQSKYIVFGMDCSGNTRKDYSSISRTVHTEYDMDCSGNTRKDYSTLVGVDVTNSEVVCTMRVNGFSITRFAQAVGYILLYLFPEATLVGERNYVGKVVLEVIEGIIGKTRIFKDEKDEENGVNLVHKLRNIMYGDVLRVSVVQLGKLIHDKTIIEEIAGLITDKHGRIDHKQNGGHDDLLIAYLYCRWFIMYSKTKNRYIDQVYFNSRLNEYLSDVELEEISKYSGDRFNYETVSSVNGSALMNIEKEYNKREQNNNFVLMQIKNQIDGVYNRERNFNSNDYLDLYDDTPIIKENDISVDTIAEEYKDDYHEYTEDLDKDDPDKIEQETAEKRDKSEDPPENIFSFNFMTGLK